MANQLGLDGGYRRMLALIFLLLLLYTLGAGPVFYFVERTGNGVDAMRTVYAPLLWLRNNTPLRTPLDWYFDMWKHAAR
jgi:hypothetical protein